MNLAGMTLSNNVIEIECVLHESVPIICYEPTPLPKPSYVDLSAIAISVGIILAMLLFIYTMFMEKNNDYTEN